MNFCCFWPDLQYSSVSLLCITRTTNQFKQIADAFYRITIHRIASHHILVYLERSVSLPLTHQTRCKFTPGRIVLRVNFYCLLK